jgi:hypothetical protein
LEEEDNGSSTIEARAEMVGEGDSKGMLAVVKACHILDKNGHLDMGHKVLRCRTSSFLLWEEGD